MIESATVPSKTTCTRASGTVATFRHRLSSGAGLHHCSLRVQGTSKCSCLSRLRQPPSGAKQQVRHVVSAVAITDQEARHPTPLSKPTAQQIFTLQHVPQWSPSLVLYFPIGKCADPSYRILGLQIKWHCAELIPKQRHVIVSNHLTAGDLMMLYSLPQHYVHLISAKLPERISKASNHRVKLWHATKEIYQDLSDNARQSDPIHLFPEGVMTNGSGMVQFSRGFMRFGRNLPIVPVALRVSVPWNIQTHTLTSSFAANLFWFCFVPWVKLDATVLKPMSLAEGQGNGAFVESVQKVIAAELGVGIADMTNQEKKQLIRQYSKKRKQ